MVVADGSREQTDGLPGENNHRREEPEMVGEQPEPGAVGERKDWWLEHHRQQQRHGEEDAAGYGVADPEGVANPPDLMPVARWPGMLAVR